MAIFTVGQEVGAPAAGLEIVEGGTGFILGDPEFGTDEFGRIIVEASPIGWGGKVYGWFVLPEGSELQVAPVK